MIVNFSAEVWASVLDTGESWTFSDLAAFRVPQGCCVGLNGINYLGIMIDNQLIGVGEQTWFLD